MNSEILEREGVILKGHFLLTSGYHSDIYFEKFRLLENPKILVEMIKEIIEKNSIKNIDYVIGPAVGGIAVAYEFARQLQCKSAYIEKRETMGLFRDTPIKKEHKILLVDDVLTTGKSLNIMIDIVKKINNNITGIAVLIDRSNNASFGYNLFSNIKVNANIYSKENCPMCKQGIELIRPGGKR